MVATLNSRTSAHSVTATVAPFRAWRSSQLAVAREPKRATLEASAELSEVSQSSAIVYPVKLGFCNLNIKLMKEDHNKQSYSTSHLALPCLHCVPYTELCLFLKGLVDDFLFRKILHPTPL